MAPLLLTLPLLLGLGALIFAATDDNNTIVNVNVNTTQTNTNGKLQMIYSTVLLNISILFLLYIGRRRRSFDYESPDFFDAESIDDVDVNVVNMVNDSDLFVVPKLMPEEVEFVEDRLMYDHYPQAGGGKHPDDLWTRGKSCNSLMISFWVDKKYVVRVFSFAGYKLLWDYGRLKVADVMDALDIRGLLEDDDGIEEGAGRIKRHIGNLNGGLGEAATDPD